MESAGKVPLPLGKSINGDRMAGKNTAGTVSCPGGRRYPKTGSTLSKLLIAPSASGFDKTGAPPARRRCAERTDRKGKDSL